MTRASNIKQGDRYVRPEDPDFIWVVERLIELPGLPMHAKLVAESRRNKTMTISETALNESNLYQRLETPAIEDFFTIPDDEEKRITIAA